MKITQRLFNWSFVHIVIILFVEKNIEKSQHIMFSLIKTTYYLTNSKNKNLGTIAEFLDLLIYALFCPAPPSSEVVKKLLRDFSVFKKISQLDC